MVSQESIQKTSIDLTVGVSDTDFHENFPKLRT